jgi:ssDNA thymidine ADP-ribosyltransferase DarT-like protein
MEEIQEIRANKVIPGGRPLHDYANLYFHARNPMLRKRAVQHAGLCVLRVSTEILDLPGAVITDGNSASGYTAFRQSPAGLAIVDRDLVFAEYWTDPNQIVAWQKKSAKCAEVLVPDEVPARFIVGAYVSCPESQRALIEAGFDLPITVDPHLFFRG